MSESTPIYGSEPTYIVGPPENGLTLNEYQRRAMTTCMDSCENHSYMFYGLMGEVGELFGKIAKHIRKGKIEFRNNSFVNIALTEDEIHDLKAELGDCQWFIAGIATMCCWKLNDIGQENLAKLADRKARGVIDSSGDNR